MNSKEVRQKYIDFVTKEGHVFVPSVSLLPENDPSVLFVTAGVQPLIPYILGEKHPQGNRIANIQKCVRTQDIDAVGDATHDTFFEMMGYWSFGDYFKEKSINQLYNFFVNELKLDKNKLYVTCFEGDENAPKDTESAEVWKSLGIPEERIYFLGIESNWWAPGETGPCGPDTEVFYDISGGNLNLKSKEAFIQANEQEKLVEIANSVFMQYEKKDGKVIRELSQKNVDMGSGFERVIMAVQNKDNIFDTDLFKNIIEITRKITENEKSARIIADHIRTAIFMISDGVIPSNTERGYVLRRLIRKSVIHTNKKDIEKEVIEKIIANLIDLYEGVYDNLKTNHSNIISVLLEEINKFKPIVEKGLLEVKKLVDSRKFDAESAFNLTTEKGLPKDMMLEILDKSEIEAYKEKMKAHQELSRTSSAGKFKGGLAGDSEIEKRYHTATHLLNAALKKVLGEHISQKGSNINVERMRFDFSHGEKMTEDQKKQTENLVNEWIQSECNVVREEMSYEKAKESGAIGVFENKYGDVVSVYSIIDKSEKIISRELCGGPHVKNTKEIGKFKIIKEEASSQGVRRIKARIE